MATYSSAKEVREALQLARINAKNARKDFGKESPEAQFPGK